jgi:uncharacterized protein YegL
MQMAEQLPYGALGDGIGIANNPEPRCPCVLLVDVSGSMSEIVSGAGRDLGYTTQVDGKTYNVVSGGTTRIDLVNEGLQAYAADVQSDSLASQRVEVAVVTFGSSVETVVDFVGGRQFNPPKLEASGNTRMGEAILRAIDMVEERKAAYKRNGLAFYRPWIFMITDGEPTDGEAWKEAAARVQEKERDKKLLFFCVGVDGANFDILGKISTARQPLKLKGYSFKEMFLWLSASQRIVSASQTTDKPQLPAPTSWGDPW